MAQNNIRSYGGVQYSISEGAALIDELNNRTRSTLSAYDNLQKVGDALASMTIDNALSDTSEKAVQNKVVKAALDTKIGDAPSDGKSYTRKDASWQEIIPTTVDNSLSDTSENAIQNKVVKAALDTKIGDAPNDGKLYIRKNESWDVLTPVYTIEGTYAELKTLKDGGNLIPGVRYIMTDYKTEYFVLGTNSSPIIKTKEITSLIAGWAVLNNNVEPQLPNGTTVTISKLPSGYSGSLNVGDTTTVSSQSSQYYFRFANGMQNVIGLEFTFGLTRYNTIAADAVINDANGKPVMRPNGIVNTEIHDGTDYCDMTAAENLTVPTERIVLTASTSNTFEEVGYSETYADDVIHFDFDDTEIKNDNLQVIGSRKGYITRRINTKLNIDTKVDWRVLRFRRWLIDSSSRTQLINQDLANTTRVGFDGKYLFTAQNRTSAQTDQFYVARVPEQVMNNINENALIKTFTSVVDGNIKCKDFNIIPLDSSYNPINVTKFVLDNIWDSVFIGLSGEYSYKIYVDKVVIQNSTFVSNPIINGNNLGIWDSIFLDSFSIVNSLNSIIKNIVSLSYTSIGRMTNTTLTNVIFGTQKGGDISGTPVPNPAVKWFIIKTIDNCKFDGVVMGQASVNLYMIGSTFVNSSLFIYYSPVFTDGKEREVVNINGSLFSNTVLRIPRNVDRISLNDILFKNTNSNSSDGLFLYDTTAGSLSFANIKKNDADDKLYYTTIDAANAITYHDIVSPTLTP